MGTNVAFSIKSSFRRDYCADLKMKNDGTSFVLCSNPRFCLSGEFKFNIGYKEKGCKVIQFKTSSQFGRDLIFSANQLDGDKLELGPFEFSQMVLRVRVNANATATEIAMCGRIQLRKINLS